MRLSKQPKEGQSYQRLKSAINDCLIAGKFRFFAKTSAKLNKFLVSHQMEKPMVPFIGHMHQPTCLERSWKKLFVIIQYQFKGCSMHKRATHINLLTPIKIELSDLTKNGKINDTPFPKFKSDVVSFLSASCCHLFKKSPMKYSLTGHAWCFIPSLLVEAPETDEKKIILLLETTSQQMPEKMAEEAKREFKVFTRCYDNP